LPPESPSPLSEGFSDDIAGFGYRLFDPIYLYSMGIIIDPSRRKDVAYLCGEDSGKVLYGTFDIQSAICAVDMINV
jgi:hypothetical protein